MNAALKALGWSQSAFARFMGRNPRSVRRWCSGDPEPPMEAVMLLAAMLEYGITPQRLEVIKRGTERQGEDKMVPTEQNPEAFSSDLRSELTERQWRALTRNTCHADFSNWTVIAGDEAFGLVAMGLVEDKGPSQGPGSVRLYGISAKGQALFADGPTGQEKA